MKAAILDYGLGNIHSLRGALLRLGHEVDVVAGRVPEADLLVLPGVGAWAPAAEALAPVADAIRRRVRDGTPLLGVCLGHQLLYETSDEGPGAGLGILEGHVHRLGHGRLPHIGWNTLDEVRHARLKDLEGRHVYYVHTYAARPGVRTAAVTSYGEPFEAIVLDRNVAGTQFHPEKSGATGRAVLERLLEALG